MPSEHDIISESEKIELHSEEVNEIIGGIPPWIVRWGVTTIFIIIFLIVTGSFLFKYPDSINSSVLIVSENPPASVVAQSSGKIEHLYVENSDKVKPGEVLAVIENTADYDDVLKLEQKLKEIGQLFDVDKVNELPLLSDNLSLGSIQTSYSSFYHQYMEYKNFITLGLFDKKIVSLRQEMIDYRIFLTRMKSQANSLEKTVKLSYAQYKRDSLLYSEGIISAVEVEKSEKQYLLDKGNLQNLLTRLSSTQIELNQIEYEIANQKNMQTEQRLQLIHTLKEAYDNLKMSIREWKKKCLLVSSIDGIITFTRFWSHNQYVLSGDVVFTVVPTQPQKIVGRIKVPMSGSGKVSKGQSVHVRLYNYPHEEFGMLEGKIKSMSLIPENNENDVFYIAIVELTDGLTTNYGRTLPFHQHMQGNAEIITDDLSLFDRLMNPLKSVLKKSANY